jgi:tetratricopeptide (TPR) repeat protein
VTYETVLLKLRRVYHAQVAAWLEANAGERLGEYLSLIAGHHERAGDRAKAADCLRRAGEELLRVSAFREAIAACERALALLPAGDETNRAVLLLRVGTAYSWMNYNPRAITYLEEALGPARKLGDVRTEVAALNELGYAVYWQGDHATAVQCLEDALARAREHRDQVGTAHALWYLGYMAAREGDAGAAEAYAEESLTLYRELGDRQGIANVLNVLGITASFTGNQERAEAHFRDALAIHREIGDRSAVGRRLNNLAYVARHQGRLQEALRYARQSLSIARELGERTIFPLGNLAAVQARLGRADAAWSAWREGMAESVATGAAPPILSWVAIASVWLAEAGQFERAAELVGLARHRALDREPQIESEPALVILRQALSADELEAAMVRGRALDLDAVVAELLKEE